MLKYIFILFFIFPSFVSAKQFKSVSLVFDSDIKLFTLVRNGGGRSSIVQGLTLDSTSHSLYTITSVGSPALATINRFDYSTDGILYAKSFSLPSEFVGHQSIAIEPGEKYLYSSASNLIGSSGWYIVRFSFSDKAPVSDIVPIRVFGNKYNSKAITSPAVSTDGKYLLVYGELGRDKVIRIFPLDSFNQKIDMSDSVAYEWNLDVGFITKDSPVQSIVSDGQFVFVLSGGPNYKNKKIHIYTLDGVLVKAYDNITIGLNESKKYGIENHWEPEGLAIDSLSRKLLLMYAMGDSGKRVVKVYSLPIKYDN